MKPMYTLESKIRKGEWEEFGNYHIAADAKFAENLQNTSYRLRDNETGKIVWRFIA